MKIGFIGLGIMGESMSANIVRKHNDKVFVSDLNRAQVEKLAAQGAVAVKIDQVHAQRGGCRTRDALGGAVGQQGPVQDPLSLRRNGQIRGERKAPAVEQGAQGQGLPARREAPAQGVGVLGQRDRNVGADRDLCR